MKLLNTSLVSTQALSIYHTLMMSTQNSLVTVGAKDPTWWDNPAIYKEMLPVTMQTLAMTGVSALFSILFGVPIGLLVVATAKDGLIPNSFANKILSFIVDLGRSIPFLILAVFINPLTRLIVGTTLGWKAACVPLIVGATPFFARLVESNIMRVDHGKIEAAQMMGASKGQIMWGVQVREALPSLIQSATVLVITIISYSTVSGALGGGGIGALAINYGHSRYQFDTLVVSIVVICLIVMVLQAIGDWIARRVDHR